MTIKNQTILRILTKWCDQLWQKFEEPNYYSNRSENIKVQKGGFVNLILPWMRQDIDNRLKVEKSKIISFLK